MKSRVTFVQIGLGPIGIECLRQLTSTGWAVPLGAVDIHPARVGADLGELTGNKELKGLRCVSDLSQLARAPDLAFHTTVSDFSATYVQLIRLAELGSNVVSSCEEMAFPYLRHPSLASRLDKACRKAGVRMVGAGVNPGFVMDVLPLCVAQLSHSITEIRVERVVNASTRREPLQRKIGSGLTPATLRKLLRKEQAGHSGLKESLALLAHGLGTRVKRISSFADAIVASKTIRTAFVRVRRGQACGIRQSIKAELANKVRLSLDLAMYLDAEDPHDRIQIHGEPPVDLTIRGGLAGDQATVAALMNTAQRLMHAPPGLRLLTDLPLR